MSPSTIAMDLPQETTTSAAEIADIPAADQSVVHNGKTYTTVQEGLAYILVPPEEPRKLDPKTYASDPAQTVFYNPIQQYNRDLTVLAIRAFGEDFLARHAVNGKKSRGKRATKKGKPKDGGEAEKGFGQVAMDTGSAPDPTNGAYTAQPAKDPGGQEGTSTNVKNTTEETNGKKRKGRDSLNATSVSKRSKVGSDGVEFEDDGIDDDDLLAVESTLHDNAPFSTAIEGVEESNDTSGTPQDKRQPAPQSQPRDNRPPFRILDALSATGLRALRYAQELPFNVQVTANDLKKSAVEAIKLNVQHNRLESKIKASIGNANAHMYSLVGQEAFPGSSKKYHVIDLDPYGTAVPFLDAAVQATTDGGLLCVTCTDTGVFNSTGYAEKAFSLYGGVSGRGEHCHEIGLRLILNSITMTAAKYGISIEPLLSLSIDYYARVFVRVKRSPADVKFLGSKSMLVYACDHGCGAWKTQFLMRAVEQQGKQGTIFHKHVVGQGPSSDKLCECCGSKMHIVGPLYGGPLHNPSFIQKVLDLLPTLDKETYKTIPRIEGMLSTAQEEMLLFDTGKLTIPNKPPRTAVPSEKPQITAQDDKAGAGAGQQQSESTSKEPEATTEKDAKPGLESSAEDLAPKMYESLNNAAIDFHPFYVIPSALARVIHCQAPSDAALRGALRGLGFTAVRSHTGPGTIKTDAPWEAIWDIMYAWTKEKPIKEGALKENSAGLGVMTRAKERYETRVQRNEGKDKFKGGPRSDEADGQDKNGKDQPKADEAPKDKWLSIVFDEKLGKREVNSKPLVRYQINPRANWGPMAKAK